MHSDWNIFDTSAVCNGYWAIWNSGGIYNKSKSYDDSVWCTSSNKYTWNFDWFICEKVRNRES